MVSLYLLGIIGLRLAIFAWLLVHSAQNFELKLLDRGRCMAITQSTLVCYRCKHNVSSVILTRQVNTAQTTLRQQECESSHVVRGQHWTDQVDIVRCHSGLSH